MSYAYTADGKRRSSMTHARRGHECSLCGRVVFGNGGQVVLRWSARAGCACRVARGGATRRSWCCTARRDGMSALDRAALIEAATEAAQRIVASPQFNTNAVQRTVDAVLVATVMPAALDAVVPLIADAIAMSRIEMYDEATPGTVTYDFAVNVKSKAGRLVRSLLSTDSDQ